MNKTKIKINKLGPISNSTIEIGQLMIFSGESGIGKSYCAILSHFIFVVLQSRTELQRFFATSEYNIEKLIENKKDETKSIDLLKLSKRTLEDWLSKAALEYLQFMLGDRALSGDIEIALPSIMPSELIFVYRKRTIKMGGEDNYNHSLTLEGQTILFMDFNLAESPIAMLLRLYLSNCILGKGKKLENAFVMPPSRGSILTEGFIPKTGMYQKFIQGLQFINQFQEKEDNVSQTLARTIANIIDGSVYKVDDHYDFVMSSGYTIPLSAAAASVKELAPIELLVRSRNMATTTILIEEPEAHLHPLKQRMIADVLATMYSYGAHIQITTHSDYIIRRLNELVQLQQIKDKSNAVGNSDYVKLYEKCGVSTDLNFDLSSIYSFFLERNITGSTFIEEQVLKDGIPFASFRKAIEASLNNNINIDNYLDGDDDE